MMVLKTRKTRRKITYETFTLPSQYIPPTLNYTAYYENGRLIIEFKEEGEYTAIHHHGNIRVYIPSRIIKQIIRDLGLRNRLELIKHHVFYEIEKIEQNRVEGRIICSTCPSSA